MKTLYFEGAGCVPANDVENCRIRTAFTNKDGNKIYLELISGYKHTRVEWKNGRKLKYPKWITEDGYLWCDFCHYITNDPSIDDCNCNHLPCERNMEDRPKYTKENILDFVNKNCNADFDNIVVLDNLAGYKVFADGKHNTFAMYNFGDEFEYNAELTEKRIAKVNELKENFCKLFDQEYDNTSYYIKDGKLMVCINVEEEKRIKAGYTERRFSVEV